MNERNLMRDDPATYWNQHAGPGWVRAQAGVDRMLAPITEHLLEMCAAREGERVIDVGCGCGGTTLAFAERVGPRGRVLGVDISRPMLQQAQQRGREIEHLELVCADAASHPFEPGWADLVTSRFGVMFFPEPAKAFANLRSAMRAEGRLVAACWQAPQLNGWITYTLRAFPELEPPTPDPHEGPGPFSLSSLERVRSILDEAGFIEIRIEPFSTTVQIGGSAEEAFETFSEVGPLSRLLSDASDEQRPEVEARARRFLEQEFADGPPALPAAVWVLCARAGG